MYISVVGRRGDGSKRVPAFCRVSQSLRVESAEQEAIMFGV